MSDINRARLKKFKKEHPKEYRELIRQGKKEWMEYVRNQIKMQEKQVKEDEQERKAYLEDLSKTTTKLSDVVDIVNTRENVGIKALFRYVKGAYTSDEQEYLDRALYSISYMEELINSGRLRPSQVKAIMKRRSKEYKKFAKYFRKKFKKEPPTYEQIYKERQEYER